MRFAVLAIITIPSLIGCTSGQSSSGAASSEQPVTALTEQTQVDADRQTYTYSGETTGYKGSTNVNLDGPMDHESIHQGDDR